MRRVLSIFYVLAIMLAVLQGLAEAAPQLILRDRLEIQLEPIRRVGGYVRVAGKLVTRSDGLAASSQEVRITMDEVVAVAYTDEFGYFTKRFELSDNDGHNLAIEAVGRRHYDGASLRIDDFRAKRRPLSLQLIAPGEIADTDGIELEIRSTSETLPVSSTLEVSISSLGGAPRPLGSVTTDANGDGRLTLEREDLGDAGRKRIEVRFAGDENFDPATAATLFVMTSTSSLRLSARDSEVSFGETIALSGRLEDGRGEAIAGAVVTIEVQAQRVGSAKTDNRGDFHVALDSEELGSGTSIVLQAVYRPAETWKQSKRSEPLTVVIGTRKPLSMSLALAAFAVTGLGLLSFVGLRARPWERIHRSKNNTELTASEEEGPEEPPKTGLAEGRPKLGDTFRKAHYMDIEGHIRNAMNHEPIDMARLEVTGTPPQVMQTNAKGWFRTAHLHAGQHTLKITADGFVTETCVVEVPHRGQFHGSTIDLLPVREKIFAIYKDALRPRLPNPKLWGIWTPRQILDHVRASGPSPALATLTDFVEETFFSPRTPNESILEHARSLVWAFTKEEPGQGPRA